MSDLVINVKQVSSYPQQAASNGTESLLVQRGGVGGPYASMATASLVATALNNHGPAFGAGVAAPPDAAPFQIFSGNHVLLPNLGVAFNTYIGQINGVSANRVWASGYIGTIDLDGPDGAMRWTLGGGTAGEPSLFVPQMYLSQAGNLALINGTLSVARDPAVSSEVATLGWINRSTVTSFNARRGTVTLTAADIYQALQLCDPIATQTWVIQSINAGIGDLLTKHPLVFCWNGRTGNVFLTLSDITTVFYQPGQQPISPTPSLTSNDDSIATTRWVTEFIENELAGSGGTIATQSWVLANTVNSFNGRMGVVTLTQADVFGVGAAPLNSPNFSGIPTAPTAAQGQATGQIATTAFVQQAIAHNTAGVSTFNTRSGDVVLTNADVTTAGGITNPSANLTGAPTAPTAAPGTSSSQIANTQFVMTALGNAVTSFNTRTGAVVLQLSDITGVGGAPIVSPAFSSVPTAPTAAPGTNTVQLATCAFVTNALNTAGGVSSFNGRTGAIDLLANDVSAVGGLMNPSVNLTGTPTAPTAPTNTNTGQIATTAFVVAALGGTVTSFNTRTGAIVLTGPDIQGAGGALLAGPAFTGTPTAPTATAGTANTQLATTQFVMSAIAADTTGVTSFNSRTGAVSLLLSDITAAGGAPSASPAFTGTPAAPTAVPGTATTQLATTQFVMSAIASAGVASFNGRTGAVTLIANDISAASGALLASPAFTGVPTAPTAAANTSTTQIATTAYVTSSLASFLPLTGGQLSGSLGLPFVTATGIPGATSNLRFNTTTPAGAAIAAGPGGVQFVDSAGMSFYVFPPAVAGAAFGAPYSWLFDRLGNTVMPGGVIPTNFANPPIQMLCPSAILFPINNAIYFNTYPSGGNYYALQNGVCGYFYANAPNNNIGLAMWPGNGTAGQALPGNPFFYVFNQDGSIGLPSGPSGSCGIKYLAHGPNIIGFGWTSGCSLWIDTTNNGFIQTTGSDASLKDNIQPITTDCLATLMRVPLRQFDWKPTEIGQKPHASAGLVAQEVEPLIPEAVGSDGTMLSLDLMPLLAYCIGAIQQLAGRLETLEMAA